MKSRDWGKRRAGIVFADKDSVDPTEFVYFIAQLEKTSSGFLKASNAARMFSEKILSNNDFIGFIGNRRCLSIDDIMQLSFKAKLARLGWSKKRCDEWYELILNQTPPDQFELPMHMVLNATRPGKIAPLFEGQRSVDEVFEKEYGDDYTVITVKPWFRNFFDSARRLANTIALPTTTEFPEVAREVVSEPRTTVARRILDSLE